MKVDVYMPLYLGDYARDTGDLTAEEHGAYLLIMMAMWAAGGSIPVGRCAAFSKVPPRRWPAVWETIKRFFLITGDMASQGRLIRELEAAERKRTTARTNGFQGGRPKTQQDNNLSVSPGLTQAITKTPNSVNLIKTSSPSPSESGSDPETDSCETPLASSPPAAPSVLEFPCDGKVKVWGLVAAQIAEWREAYPALDVLGECRKALAWIKANPASHKTARGMPAFLVAWLNRAQNDGRRTAGQNTPAQRPVPYHAPPKPLPQLPAGVDSAAEIERWRRERDQLAERKGIA